MDKHQFDRNRWRDMKAHYNFITGLYRALVLPDKAFLEDALFASSRFPLFFLILVLAFSGAASTWRFHQNETMNVLSAADNARRIDSILANVPEEDRNEMVEQVTAISGGTAASIIGLIVSTALWFVLFIEIWLLGILLMQFLGGEETPVGEKKHRKSQFLSLYCLIPLSFQELARGIVYYFKDASAIGSVLTLGEYDLATRVSFSVLALFGVSGAGGLMGFLLLNVTNPFFLWTVAVALFGGKGVFRVGAGKMTIALAVIFVFVGIQGQLLAGIQTFFGR
jgi:hypothetical protein